MKYIDIDEIDLNSMLDDFYLFFDNGFEFEDFLYHYLNKIGLDEIEVTQKSRDGGVDLKCTKKGLDKLTDLDEIKYYVQAKRYKPNSTVPINDVRALRGVIPDGYKGIFITTGKFSNESYKFAKESTLRPLILIDGKQLIINCIDIELGFKHKPIFSSENLSSLIKPEIQNDSNISEGNKLKEYDNYIRKNITLNDIRAKILPIPSSILEKIPESFENYRVKFSNEKILELKINRERKYFGGTSQIYKDFGLVKKDGTFQPCESLWQLISDDKIIEVFFEFD